jgi:hypothetical protein
VHFRGENDYVHVAARKMPGSVAGFSSRARSCLAVPVNPPAASSSKAGSHRRVTMLLAANFAADGPLATAFAALKEPRAPTYLFGEQLGRVGGVGVYRSSFREGRPADLRVNKRLTKARVRPTPAAFRGRAHFNKKRRRWLGPLHTSYPGAPNVHLAGPGFRADLFRFRLSAIFD